eukprot:3378315-Pyramimonas_sp.AAC.1
MFFAFSPFRFRWLCEAPRWLHDGLRRAPKKGPNRALKRPQERPRAPQNRPRGDALRSRGRP